MNSGVLTKMKKWHLVELGAVGRLTSQHVAGELDHRKLRSTLGTQRARGQAWSKCAQDAAVACRCQAVKCWSVTVLHSCCSAQRPCTTNVNAALP